jgi:hypothetical protein
MNNYLQSLVGRCVLGEKMSATWRCWYSQLWKLLLNVGVSAKSPCFYGAPKPLRGQVDHSTKLHTMQSSTDTPSDSQFRTALVGDWSSKTMLGSLAGLLHVEPQLWLHHAMCDPSICTCVWACVHFVVSPGILIGGFRGVATGTQKGIDKELLRFWSLVRKW